MLFWIRQGWEGKSHSLEYFTSSSYSAAPFSKIRVFRFPARLFPEKVGRPPNPGGGLVKIPEARCHT